MRYVLLLVALCSCGGPLVRIAQPQLSGAPPVIEKLVDFGALELPATGELVPTHNDGHFTPGEYLAIVGSGLANEPKVFFDDLEVPVAGYLKGGSILVRVPRGLSARTSYGLAVRTTHGEAKTRIKLTSYLVHSDISGNQVSCRQVMHGDDIFAESTTDIPLMSAMLHTFSADGGFAFALQGDGPLVTNCCELLVIHLGAYGEPEEIARIPVGLQGSPTDIALSGPNTLAILDEHSLTFLDVSDPTLGAQLSRLDLRPAVASGDGAARRFIDVSVEGERVWVLEAYSNTLLLVNAADPRSPWIEAQLPMAHEIEVPFSVGLAEAEPGSVWVLQGINVRVAEKIGVETFDLLKAKAATIFNVDLGADPNASGPQAMETDGVPTLARLARVALASGKLNIVETRPLPDGFFPLNLRRHEGHVYVSGLNWRVLDFSRIEPSVSAVYSVVQTIVSSAEFGRVLRVHADRKPELVQKGIAIYGDLTGLPGNVLVWTKYGLGVDLLPVPKPKLDWSIEVSNGERYPIRPLDWKFLIPPYSFGTLSMP